VAAKKQTIVIKKIIVQGGGHHGGSWKVALADFMTALMAFFLVMWLIGQSEQTKKSISDYFSTPSVIEYNFQNFGAEITLEKLFLDFVNEPLKAFQSFLEPADKTPNVLDMGSEKVVAAFMADKLSDKAKNVTISNDGFEFDIPDVYLFDRGTAKPKVQFVELMDRLTAVTGGLDEAEIKITSALFIQLVADQTKRTAELIARERLELVKNKIGSTFEKSTNSVSGETNVRDKKGEFNPDKLIGFIRISIKQKPSLDPEKHRRPLNSIFKKDKDRAENKSEDQENQGQLDSSSSSIRKAKRTALGGDPNFVNPVEVEMRKIEKESEPLEDADQQ
jgi:chemotaxis protein MotB